MCATALCVEMVPRGQAADLPPADQRVLTPHMVSWQTFGLEMSVLAGHVEGRCIAAVQLRAKRQPPALVQLRICLQHSSALCCQGAELKALSASRQHRQLNPKWSRWDRRSPPQPSMCPTKPYFPVPDTQCQISLRDRSRKSEKQESIICASCRRIRRPAQCVSEANSRVRSKCMMSDSGSRLAQPKGCEPASPLEQLHPTQGPLAIVPSGLMCCQKPEIVS